MDRKPDWLKIKAQNKNAWMAGDYASFASYWAPGASEILAGWAIPLGGKRRCEARTRLASWGPPRPIRAVSVRPNAGRQGRAGQSAVPPVTETAGRFAERLHLKAGSWDRGRVALCPF